MSKQTEKRRNKLIMNTISSLTDEIVALVASFILPRAILGAYGSEVNGLVSSVTQFLSLISFMDLGVGAVIYSSLYKPLAEGDNARISRIVKSAKRFFRKIALIYEIYVVALIVIYPIVMDQEIFSTIALIAAISIAQFARYYFGLANQILLGADQRSYIPGFLNVGTVALNLVFSVILIQAGAPIYIVKLTTSVIFLARPLGMGIYVNKHYNIDKDIEIGEEPIKQKWDGMAQHLSAMITDNTDVTILTVFSTLSNISVYTVYYTVVHGIRMVVTRLFSGMGSLIGDIYARDEKENLDRISREFEFVNHAVVAFLFSCTGALIVPFIRIYTDGITDADYIAPLFAAVLAASQAVFCLRTPYEMVIKAAGHFRETRNGAIGEVVINIVVSVAAVIKFGLVGIAAGTLLAMLFRTYYLWIYSFKHLLNRKMSEIVKLTLFDVVVSALIIAVGTRFTLSSVSYLSWVIMAFEVCGCGLVIITVATMLFYRREAVGAVKSLVRKKSK